MRKIIILSIALLGWVSTAISSTTISSAPISSSILTSTPSSTDAQVALGRGGLRLRQLPSTTSTTLTNLPETASLKILGRTPDSSWLLVEISSGHRGWVWAAFVDVFIDLNTVPIIQNPEPAPLITLPSSSATVNVGGARNIFLLGQTLGNRPNVFTKVGDSISATPYFLQQFNWSYNLGPYEHLLPVLLYFSEAGLINSNSFGHSSQAAVNSWSTREVLDPAFANPALCLPTETPLQCEYRTVKPALSLIMIGTNDVPFLTTDQYAQNMRRIVQITADMGVIPVLSTLPSRIGFDWRIAEYNAFLKRLAREIGLPLWDYAAAMAQLPNRGMGPDGVHPSLPPDPNAVTDFRGDNLNYGFTIRNLTALQILDTVWRQILYPAENQ